MEYILFIFICAVAIQAFMFYTRWLYTSRKLPKIKILEFFKLYKVNADVWVLEDNYVKYNRRYQYNSETKTSISAYDCELGFHLLGFLIYIIWHRYYEYNKMKRKNAQVYLDFCHAAKEDFEKIERDKK